MTVESRPGASETFPGEQSKLAAPLYGPFSDPAACCGALCALCRLELNSLEFSITRERMRNGKALIVIFFFFQAAAEVVTNA
jgi:hypothetical protein